MNDQSVFITTHDAKNCERFNLSSHLYFLPLRD